MYPAESFRELIDPRAHDHILPRCPVPNRVCELARIEIPIIQAPMTYIAGARLAAAVSNAGALGIIETTSDQGRADLKRVRELTDGAVGANIALIMNRDPAMVELLVASDIRFVTTSAGDPSLFTDRLHDAGITVFHVVGTLAAAKKAVDAGVDGLVVEGVEGGGFKNRFGRQRWCCCRWWRPMSTYRSWPPEEYCDARSMAAAFVLGAEGVGWARDCWPRPIPRCMRISSKRLCTPTKPRRCYSPSTASG